MDFSKQRNEIMFKYKNRLVLLIMTLTLAIVLSAGAGLLSYAVEDNLEVSTASEDFEASIADFPESYKPYLRELHEKYPDWVFEAFETDLEWDTVIDNEWGIYNLISDSAASENLKSKESGHYNQDTGKYIQKDAGFVVANRLAVEYYMDPRNFLNEEGIFQFEKLTFSDAVTMAVIRRYTVLPVLFIVACTPIVPAIKERLEKKNALVFNAVSGVCYVGAMVLSLLFIIGQSYNPFIYFRF